MSKSTFIDFRAVKAAVSLEQVLQHYGVLKTLHGSGDTRRGPCPIHHGSKPNQFSVNLAKGIWNCFSDCKCGGNTLDFVAKREGVEIHKAASLLCEWFDLKLEPRQDEPAHQPARPAKAVERGLKPSPAPEPTNHTPNKPLGFALKDLQPDHPYLAERGITTELATEFGIGFFPGSKGLMVGRIVIPIHNPEGALVAYAGRFPGDPPNDDVPKYKLPPGFKKGQELFNLHRASKEQADQPLVLVEGFFGAIKLWQCGVKRVVALMGSTLSTAQEELLREHTDSHSQMLVLLDEDDAGRAGRQDIVQRLAPFVFVKAHAFAQPGQQPENLTAEEIGRLFL